MADIDNEEFNVYYQKYHPGDTALTCHNDTIYYNDESKQIYGYVGVYKGEQVKLVNNSGHRYSVRQINPNVYKLDNALLFFDIKESVKFYKKDLSEINNKVSFFLSRFNKNNLSKPETTLILAEIDEYLVLKQNEKVLSEGVYDYVKVFENRIYKEVLSKNYESMSDGYKVIYYKIFEAMRNYDQEHNQDQSNSSSSQNDLGFTRAKIGVAGKSKKNNENVVLSSDNVGTFGDAAFTSLKIILTVVSIILLVIITIAIAIYLA